jgi:hypothetical protein
MFMVCVPEELGMNFLVLSDLKPLQQDKRFAIRNVTYPSNGQEEV